MAGKILDQLVVTPCLARAHSRTRVMTARECMQEVALIKSEAVKRSRLAQEKRRTECQAHNTSQVAVFIDNDSTTNTTTHNNSTNTADSSNTY